MADAEANATTAAEAAEADAAVEDTVTGAASGGLPRAADEADAGVAASTAAEADIDAVGSDIEAWLSGAAVPNRLLTRAAVASW